MISENSIQFAGDFTLKHIVIFSYNGSFIDITNLVNDIEIFESIDSPFLTMEMVVLDGIGLESVLPILGEEVIEIYLTSADGNNGYVKKQFFIYKKKERIQTADRSFVYTLCCMSIEALVDMNLKISKSYYGNISEIANSIISVEGLQTDKPTFIENTKNNIQYISNYWSPVKNLLFLTDRAVSSANSSSSFIFYESSRGFNFVSLDTMISQESVMSYFFSPRTDYDVKQSMQRIEKIHFDEEIDYIERAHSGAFGHRTLIVDPLSKDYNYNYYDFIECFDSKSTLNKLPFIPPSATRRLNQSFKMRISPTKAYDKMSDDGSIEWFNHRRTELASRKTFMCSIDVSGNFGVNAGNVIEVFMFNNEVSKSDSDSKDVKSFIDKIHSGRYLISHLKHKITRERHSMSMTLIKDSLMEDVYNLEAE